MACFIILIETCNGKLYQFNFRSFRKILNKSRYRSTLSVHYLGSNCNPLTIMNWTFLAGYIWVLNHRVIVLFYETVFTHSTIAWKEFHSDVFLVHFFLLFGYFPFIGWNGVRTAASIRLRHTCELHLGITTFWIFKNYEISLNFPSGWFGSKDTCHANGTPALKL